MLNEMNYKLNLDNVSTRDLVKELKHRPGVKTEYVDPHENKSIRVNGSATVLIVID